VTANRGKIVVYLKAAELREAFVSWQILKHGDHVIGSVPGWAHVGE
jgi:hypothetical protein